MKHLFPYKWNLEDLQTIIKNRYKVFSCFAGGGGSSMGYKLAGFDVLGMNEIDPKMANCYVKNLNPRYKWIEDIRKFKTKPDLPDELFNLDILDGSPPCSSFSMAGNREKDWGKEKKFREGQKAQTLDDLFFDFIDIADKLQPKIVLAENVKGLILGEAKQYVTEIGRQFDRAGYYVAKWLLDASKMGVPQKRERVIFLAMRKDLVNKFEHKIDLFNPLPFIDLEFNESIINYCEYASEKGDQVKSDERIKLLNNMIDSDKCISDINERLYNKVSGFNALIINQNQIFPTITSGELNYRKWDKTECSQNDYINSGTFPQDYKFIGNVKYIIGMSVPPVMIAQIATRIKNYWLDKI